MTKQAWLLGVMAAGLLLGACGEEDSGDSARLPTQAEIVGKWYLRRAQTKGKADVTSEFLGDSTIWIDEDSAFAGTEYYAQFGADSTFEIFQPNPNLSGLRSTFPGVPVPVDTPSRQEGRYRLDGRSLITVSGDDTLRWTATLEGSTLVLESAIDTAVSFPLGDFGTIEINGSGTLKGTYQK